MKLTRHPLDLFSLLSGLTVTTLAAIAVTDAWTRPFATWFWPSMLVLAGVLVLAAVALSGRRPTVETAAPDVVDDVALAAELADDASPAPSWAQDDDHGSTED